MELGIAAGGVVSHPELPKRGAGPWWSWGSQRGRMDLFGQMGGGKRPSPRGGVRAGLEAQNALMDPAPIG